jgi:murein DD-endopeptidase MepM/ murein hydrolase activator NlpD
MRDAISGSVKQNAYLKGGLFLHFFSRFQRLPALIAIAILLISTSAYASTESQENLQKLIKQTRQEISNQKAKEKSVLTNLSQQQKELNSLEDNHRQLQGKLTVAQTKFLKTQAEQQKLQRNLGSLEQNLSKRQRLLNERLIASYKYGPLSYLEILFRARNYADLISRFGMIAYFINNDIDSIAIVQKVKFQVKIQQQVVKQKKQQVESELKKISVLTNQVNESQKKVASKVEQTRTELAKIESNRRQLEKALEEYEETSREIGNQINKTERNNPSEIFGSGKMIWPVTGAIQITSPFGWRYHPILHVNKYHNGEDIAVPSGTPVHAADSGIVVVSGWEGGYGNYVAIDHGNGISTGYGHNSRLLVHQGERVTKGQIIAYSGSTGLSTGPHVHFEVRKNGVPIDPLPFLP